MDEYVLYKHLTKSIDLKDGFEELSDELLNEITAEFIGAYCDSAGNKEIELLKPFMNKWRYNESTKLILKTNDVDMIRLWEIIINGRSIKDGKRFKSFTNDYKVGYLSGSEYKKLNEKLKNHFGDINMDTLNEQNEGMAYVSQAINEMEKHGGEMIIGIE
ncbi:MAG: hypothetical protein LBK75_03680 [Oscillospiraceae bacterium]|nr:hypothetical protein [Oscillospiraceae bacterium]